MQLGLVWPGGTAVSAEMLVFPGQTEPSSVWCPPSTVPRSGAGLFATAQAARAQAGFGRSICFSLWPPSNASNLLISSYIMKKETCTPKFTAKQSSHLGAYLAASLGASSFATATADAAIISINIGPSGFDIAGPNAGLTVGNFSYITDFPFSSAGNLGLYNDGFFSYWGLLGGGGFSFASFGEPATPQNFVLNASIGSGAIWGGDPNYSLFRRDFYGTQSAPAFGPGSYMGFRTDQGNYGWLEVTWNGSSEWEIISGAYEDEVGVAILAGQGPSPEPIPEPGTWAAAALLAGGAAFLRWRRRRDKAQKEAA